MKQSNQTKNYLKSLQMFPRTNPNLFYLKVGKEPARLIENFSKRTKSSLVANNYPRSKYVEALVVLLFASYIPKNNNNKHYKELNVGKVLAEIRNYLLYSETVRCDIEEWVNEVKIDGLENVSNTTLEFIKVFEKNQTKHGILLPFEAWCKLCVSFIDMQFAEANCYFTLCKYSDFSSDFINNIESNISEFKKVFDFRFDSTRS